MVWAVRTLMGLFLAKPSYLIKQKFNSLHIGVPCFRGHVEHRVFQGLDP